MPYFLSMAKNRPNLLLKLGIEVGSITDPQAGSTYTSLKILDKYLVYISQWGLNLQKVKFAGTYGQHLDVDTEVDIIKEIKEKLKRDYRINL